MMENNRDVQLTELTLEEIKKILEPMEKKILLERQQHFKQQKKKANKL